MPRKIELRSGVWTWRVLEDEEPAAVGEPVNGRGPLPESRLLVLQDPTVAQNRMQVRIPRHLGEPGNEAAVEALARHPDRRELLGRDGAVWTFRRRGEQATGPSIPVVPREIEAFREGENTTVLTLPENRGLGEVTGEELLDLLR